MVLEVESLDCFVPRNDRSLRIRTDPLPSASSGDFAPLAAPFFFAALQGSLTSAALVG